MISIDQAKEIERKIGLYYELKDQMKVIKSEIQNEITEAAKDKTNHPAICNLLFSVPDFVKITDMYELGFTVADITKHIGLEYPCKKCGEKIIFKFHTKSDVKEYLNKTLKVYNYCENCRKDEQSIRDFELEKIKKELDALKSMSYRDYLNTPHWREMRKRALKSSGYKCQLCNNFDKTLDVHHRTYERRGEEYIKDLIVLCRPCHSKFHKKLPEL